MGSSLEPCRRTPRPFERATPDPSTERLSNLTFNLVALSLMTSEIVKVRIVTGDDIRVVFLNRLHKSAREALFHLLPPQHRAGNFPFL